MDEFLVALMSAAAILFYNLLNILLFQSEYKVYFRWGMVILIVVCVVGYLLQRRLEKRQLDEMGVDGENYMFYHKYTSFGNKFSYIFTYLLQDFLYEVKRRNKAYNFSKGMFRFDDSLGEYYIDCRLGWYAYFKICILKNRLSLNKLRIFSLNKCNQMILAVLPEQTELSKQVKEALENKVNEMETGKKIGYCHINQVEGSNQLDPRIRLNILEMEIARKFMMDNMDVYHDALKKQEKRKDDVREIKNLYIDLNKKN